MVGYRDRIDAGRVLAGLLEHHAGSGALVLGIPRGGVVVAAEIASALTVPLGVLTAVKVRAPNSSELAIGALTPEGPVLLDPDLVRRLAVEAATLERLVSAARAEAVRRQSVFGPVPSLAGRLVIVADDGVATGSTFRAALAHTVAASAARVVVAVPVGPPETIDRLAAEADEVVCPLRPRWFGAVGEFYEDFAAVEDGAVLDLLRRCGTG